ncbi:hypothetical protein EHQ27_12175 [Leptospira wolffii]|uniref:Uncharacterized protein n=1 Tax=Leptospira wolffii TaxID=409998 RepID=A0A2M9ZGJ2_9LEPT|nr:hypothetical protein [Leptospira wolffii]PJZ67541.1 hypothetical protein CH371_05865 [Leptospira wolffii]TGK62547.1 hypothetical protein EHQ32_06955 [Leptospira wolffii]TGK70385.1 hypothetical protein EHQ27_12175 [Leptospira wolffii]TGK74068.1 hypothetical protein EHQ35_06815 [Leptospira wolffii]TGL28927.1 hypothetical protein EHQ57_13335 [Leptospira wolffii]
MRVLGFFSALLPFLAAFYFYYERSLLGFPDGHKTELDEVHSVFFLILIFWNLIFGFLFSFLIFQKRNFRDVNRRITIVYILSVPIAFAIEIYLRSVFDHGTGG